MAYTGCCNTCKFYFEDNTVGCTECECSEIDEESLEKHYVNDAPNCPYWVESELSKFSNSEDYIEYEESFLED